MPSTTSQSKASLTRKPIKQSALPNPTDRMATMTPVFGPPIRLPRPALTTHNTGNLYTRRATPRPAPEPASASWSPPHSWAITPVQPTFRETDYTHPHHPIQSHISTSTWVTTASSISPSAEVEWKALEASGKIQDSLPFRQVLPDSKSGDGTEDIELGLRRIEGVEYVDWIAEQRGKEQRAELKEANSPSWRSRKQVVAALSGSVFLVVVLLVVVGVLAAN